MHKTYPAVLGSLFAEEKCLSIDAGATSDVTSTAGWIAEYPASNFSKLTTSLALTTTWLGSQAPVGGGPVATDAACNAYVGADFFNSSAGLAQDFVLLQQFDHALTAKQGEYDFPIRAAEGSQILYPDSISSLAVDNIGNIHAGGSTNGSMFGRPAPSTCADALPLITCAGWIATFKPATQGTLRSPITLYPKSVQEFGNSQTGLGQIAVDLYGNQHVAGVTVGAVANGGETDDAIDAFEMDFGPSSLCLATFPVSPCPRKSTSVSWLAGSPCGISVLHGTSVTFSVQIKQAASPVTTGSVRFISDGFADEAYTVQLTVKPDANGDASYATSKLPVGVHNIAAVFSGTTLLNGSNSTTDCTITVQ
jgi:hypothetical protein